MGSFLNRTEQVWTLNFWNDHSFLLLCLSKYFCVRNQIKKDKIQPKQIFWREYAYDCFQALRIDPGSSATEWNSDHEPAQAEQKLWKASVKEKYIRFKNYVFLITHTYIYMHKCAHLYLCMALALVLKTRHVFFFTQEASKHNYQFLFISIVLNVLMGNSTNDCKTWSPLQKQQQSRLDGCSLIKTGVKCKPLWE